MAHSPPATLFSRSTHPAPPGAGTLAMALFLAALFMLFAGSIVAYVLIRLTAPDAPPSGAIHLPWGLWVSTVVILASSVTIHVALTAVRHERQARFRWAMAATLGLATLFLVVQAPSLWAIVQEHLPKLEAYRAARELAVAEGRSSAGRPMPLEGLVFLLILVHALHVIGGVIPLAVATWRAWRGGYDHERHAAVRYVTMYWHFLDGVWVFMFAVLLVVS